MAERDFQSSAAARW